MKRSLHVPLWIIGTLTVAGCDDPSAVAAAQEVRQEFYTSMQDCQRDWGNDPRDCSPSAPSPNASGAGSSPSPVIVSSGGGGSSPAAHSYYAGPRYYWDRNAGHPVAVSPSGGETRALTSSFASRGTPSMAKVSTVTSVARGGFGATAHGFSAGG